MAELRVFALFDAGNATLFPRDDLPREQRTDVYVLVGEQAGLKFRGEREHGLEIKLRHEHTPDGIEMWSKSKLQVTLNQLVAAVEQRTVPFAASIDLPLIKQGIRVRVIKERWSVARNGCAIEESLLTIEAAWGTSRWQSLCFEGAVEDIRRESVLADSLRSRPSFLLGGYPAFLTALSAPHLAPSSSCIA